MKFDLEKSRVMLSELPEPSEELKERCGKYFDHFIFYENQTRSRRSGVCSHCGCRMYAYRDIESTVHGDEALWAARFHTQGHCPNCGILVEYRPAGAYRTMETLKAYTNVVLFLQDPSAEMVKGLRQSVYARCYSVFIEYHPREKATVLFVEKASYRFMPGAWYAKWRTVWAYEDCSFSWGHVAIHRGTHYSVIGNWRYCVGPHEPWQGHFWTPAQYWIVNFEALDETFMKYSQVEKYCDTKRQVAATGAKVMRYLCYYTQYPSLELAMRLGSSTAVHKLVAYDQKTYNGVNFRAKNPMEFFGITKEWWNVLKDSSFDVSRFVNELGLKIRDVSELKEVKTYVTAFDIHSARRILDACRITGQSFDKTVRYLKKNEFGYSFYCDYVDMAHKIGYDLMDSHRTFPRYLAIEHDRVMDTYRAMMKEIEENARVICLKERSRLYEYSDGEYLIRLPYDGKEIVAEGNCLHHCVAGYVDSHNKGKTTILFMRSCKDPDSPLYTIEMRERDLIQCYGKRNTPLKTERERAFLKDWLGYVFRGDGLKPKHKRETGKENIA